MSLEIKVDASRVLRAIELARSVSSRSLPKLLASTAFHVAKHAYRLTDPFPQSRIDAAMEVKVTSYTNEKRIKVSRNKKGTKFTKVIARENFKPSAHQSAPLGVLIIMARHRPGSDYNVLTDHRWQLAANPLPRGKGSKLARQAQIAAELTRMIRMRHSSTGFLKFGWSCVMRLIKQRGFGSPDVIDVSADIVRGERTQDNAGRVSNGSSGNNHWLQIENTVGTVGTPNLSARRNRWLIERGSGPLNAALTIQAQEMEARYLPRLGAELKAAWESV